MSKGLQIFRTKCSCDLENGSRSLVLKLNQSLVGIHNWYEFCDSSLKAKKVKDVKRFVMTRFVTEKFVMDGRTDGEHFYSPPPGQRGTKSVFKNK